MSSPARIDSIEALKNLRTFICNIARKISTAIDDADFEISHTLDWLKHDRYPYWKNEIRIRNDQLVRAKLELKRKQILESAMGGGHYYTDEMKAVAVAQRRFDEAEDKLKKVSRWIPELEKESHNCHAAMQSLSNFVHIDIPNKRAEIDEMIYALEAYINVTSPSTAADASILQNIGDEISVSIIPTDNIPPTPADMERLCRELRLKNPLKDLTSTLPIAKLSLNKFKHLSVSNEIMEIIKKNKKDTSSFSDNDKVAFDRSVENSDFIYLENLTVPADMKIKLYIGTAKRTGHADCCVCKISDFLISNPSHRDILSLPNGWLVILKNNVVAAVFNADNKLAGGMQPEEKV